VSDSCYSGVINEAHQVLCAPHLAGGRVEVLDNVYPASFLNFMTPYARHVAL